MAYPQHWHGNSIPYKCATESTLLIFSEEEETLSLFHEKESAESTDLPQEIFYILCMEERISLYNNNNVSSILHCEGLGEDTLI